MTNKSWHRTRLRRIPLDPEDDRRHSPPQPPEGRTSLNLITVGRPSSRWKVKRCHQQATVWLQPRCELEWFLFASDRAPWIGWDVFFAWPA